VASEGSGREYSGQPLIEDQADPDPLKLFSLWFDQARTSELDATMMALATATRGGCPSVRNVLLKGVDERGFVFFTNYRSRKAQELAETGRAGLLFTWRTLERQVRIDGAVERVSVAESDAYWDSRHVESRWAVYASRQSEVVDSRETLEAQFDAARTRYGQDTPRPDWWGGYRVIPDEIEFWQGRSHRLHDRLRYRKQPDGSWRRDRLAP
jgi:pyridoxamine 5'-phosphate oxidase